MIRLVEKFLKMTRETYTVELTEIQIGLLEIACDEMVTQAMIKKSKVKGNDEESRTPAIVD